MLLVGVRGVSGASGVGVAVDAQRSGLGAAASLRRGEASVALEAWHRRMRTSCERETVIMRWKASWRPAGCHMALLARLPHKLERG